MSNNILEAKGIEYRYADGTKALADLSLSIKKGSKVAFLGPNGAGKTTLFLHFNGILQPNKGSLWFDGSPVRYDHASLMKLRQKVGIVFQDADHQLFSATVMQDISFGPINMGLSKEDVLQRVHSSMAATDITELKDRPTHFLSEGQKKRVTIAGILAMDPSLIVFDEPTASLDPSSRKQVVDVMDKINQEGKTVIISTHDIDLAYSWADYIFVMKAGAVAGEGIPPTIFQNLDLVHRTGIHQPWLVEIYEEFKQKGWIDHRRQPPRTKEELFSMTEQDRKKLTGDD